MEKEEAEDVYVIEVVAVWQSGFVMSQFRGSRVMSCEVVRKLIDMLGD